MISTLDMMELMSLVEIGGKMVEKEKETRQTQNYLDSLSWSNLKSFLVDEKRTYKLSSIIRERIDELYDFIVENCEEDFGYLPDEPDYFTADFEVGKGVLELDFKFEDRGNKYGYLCIQFLEIRFAPFVEDRRIFEGRKNVDFKYVKKITNGVVDLIQSSYEIIGLFNIDRERVESWLEYNSYIRVYEDGECEEFSLN